MGAGPGDLLKAIAVWVSCCLTYWSWKSAESSGRDVAPRTKVENEKHFLIFVYFICSSNGSFDSTTTNFGLPNVLTDIVNMDCAARKLSYDWTPPYAYGGVPHWSSQADFCWACNDRKPDWNRLRVLQPEKSLVSLVPGDLASNRQRALSCVKS